MSPLPRVFELTAAGHAASGGAAMYIEEGNGGKSGVLLKPLDKSELNIYRSLEASRAQDPIRRFIPGFHGVAAEGGEAVGACLRLENLLYGMAQPVVMDIKLGTRTFLMSESENETPRSDLFKKLVKSHPSVLTSMELDAKAVTKRRYMQARDENSTTGSLGFRVNGTAGHKWSTALLDQPPVDAFKAFARNVMSTDEGGPLTRGCGPASVARKLVEELLKLREAMETSAFVEGHEFVGSSVLLIVDGASGSCKVSWIDFAKARVCSSEKRLSHRAPCEAGSQEEGLLIGIDNLISTWRDVARSFCIGADGSGDYFRPAPRKCPRSRLMTPKMQYLTACVRASSNRRCPGVLLGSPLLGAPHTKSRVS
jgi:1D-myo-inositol-triphosphate 3-kinase